MPRGDQLARQWKIIQTIITSGTGKTVAELASDLECHPRTVYRDLTALQVAGFPLYNERMDGRSLWAVLDGVKHHTPIPFSLTELMALYFSRDMLRVLHDTVFYDALESLFQKIRSTLPPESLTFLNNVRETFFVTRKHYKEYGTFREIIKGLSDAALQKRSVHITYYTMSRKKQSERMVDPYRLWFFNDTFYLVGFCHLRRDVRIFALERIKGLQSTDNSFTVPDDFNVESLMRGSFGMFQGQPEKIKIIFSGDVAGYITEKIWHETQRISSGDNGCIIFEAEVAVNDELKWWILSWGSRAVVLEPRSLRQALRDEAREMFQQYS